jgi:hypothetical protein
VHTAQCVISPKTVHFKMLQESQVSQVSRKNGHTVQQQQFCAKVSLCWRSPNVPNRRLLLFQLTRREDPIMIAIRVNSMACGGPKKLNKYGQSVTETATDEEVGDTNFTNSNPNKRLGSLSRPWSVIADRSPIGALFLQSKNSRKYILT